MQTLTLEFEIVRDINLIPFADLKSTIGKRTKANFGPTMLKLFIILIVGAFMASHAKPFYPDKLEGYRQGIDKVSRIAPTLYVYAYILRSRAKHME